MPAFPAFAAWHARIDDHSIARPVPSYIGAGLDDRAVEFMAKYNARGDFESRRYAQGVEVAAADTSGPDLNQHLLGAPDFGDFYLTNLQHAVAFKNCCLHGCHFDHLYLPILTSALDIYKRIVAVSRIWLLHSCGQFMVMVLTVSCPARSSA